MKNITKKMVVFTMILFSINLVAVEPRLRPLDFSQQVSPNSDGQVEGDTEVFFNWGNFRSGFKYASETIVENYLDANQDTFVNQQSKNYDLILFKTKNGLIGSKSFFINPFIGIKMVDRTEKRIGEDLVNNYWFTEENADRFFNFYGSTDIQILSSALDINLTLGGGYIMKSTDGEFRTSDATPDLDYTSSDMGFNFYADLGLLIKPGKRVSYGLTFSYHREASYYERYYIGEAAKNSYSISISMNILMEYISI